ncbi:Proline and serine-rich protein [Actinidia chinensis var. chinensis]|uniref:Proline and serine-rich protein n=1 Tax=Actinidia chinensis var. chinensis TaxID=1590841 RepID=A0A2R6PF27_ACTCC|nr:Proline and serine-rich protein [Actinidia chinensis var. chinensis]
MARIHRSAIIVLFALLSLHLTESADPPHSAPTPAPNSGADSLPPTPESPSPSPASPSPSTGLRSPPAPPPEDSAPGSSPTPSPVKKSPSPAPVTAAPGDAGSVKSNVNDSAEEPKESSGGLGGGQKAGIALGVVAGVCLVALGGILYRKRQQNIQRSQYGYAARREIL